MEPRHLLKVLILTLALVMVSALCLELYWRNRGFSPAFNDDKTLWAMTRKEVYKPADQATVFIGSSRTQFDVNIATWEKLTSEAAIQLAIGGTSPRPMLRDLGNDEKFKGRLIIGVMEPLFFSENTARTEFFSSESVEYFHSETPAQKVSAFINYNLESSLVFLEEGNFGLNVLLNDLQLHDRPGVFSFPSFPKELGATSFERQAYYTPMFLADTLLQKRQIENWIKLGALDKTPGIKGDTLEAVFIEIKTAVDKIRARGGTVLFIRPPSNGGYLETENIVYPRNQYWDAMLAYVDAPGIYFADYPRIANLVCPEWSHLAPKDARTYTEELVRILQQEKGWRFSKSRLQTDLKI